MRIGAQPGMRANTGALDTGMQLNSTHVLLRETSSRKRTKQNRLANPRKRREEKESAPAVVSRALSLPYTCESEVCE